MQIDIANRGTRIRNVIIEKVFSKVLRKRTLVFSMVVIVRLRGLRKPSYVT